jgi:soluble lytic murein transglycosylase
MRPTAAALLLLPAALLLAAGPLQAQDDPYAGARQEFQRAYSTAAALLAEAPVRDSAMLRAYPLYPYLEAVRLQRDLHLASDAAAGAVDQRIAEFLKSAGSDLAGRNLRRAWLPDLARRKAWVMFSAEYLDNGADTALRCDALQARIALAQTKELAPAIMEQWLNGHDTPPECEPAFDWLRAHKLLPPSMIDQRARLALAAGNARLAQTLARTLPPEMAAPLLQWAALIEQPQREIDRLIAQPELAVEPAALLDGWSRLGRADPDGAAQRYQALLDARKPEAGTASQLARAVALGMALSRRPGALDWFARVAPGDVDERTAEWSVRAALWAGDWTRTAQSIAAMPPALHDLARWRYWAARAAEQQGDAANARVAYAQLLVNDNYYAALSSARLGQPFAPHPQPVAVDLAAGIKIAQLPPFVRAHQLLLCDLKPLAAVEWQAGFDNLDPAWRVQAAVLALRWGWYEQGIAGASRQAVFNDYALLFPRPYDDAVQVAHGLTQVPADLIYGILRTESLYNAEAVSHAGAYGLLQLMPETAQRVAHKWQLPAPAREQLFDPMVNVQLGSAELHDLLEQFGQQWPLAIAGYNAGPNAAARWLPDAPIDAAAWIENIPYNETRDYVQRVLWLSVVFRWRASGEPQPVDSLLGQIVRPPTVPVPALANDVNAQ